MSGCFISLHPAQYAALLRYYAGFGEHGGDAAFGGGLSDLSRGVVVGVVAVGVIVSIVSDPIGSSASQSQVFGPNYCSLDMERHRQR